MLASVNYDAADCQKQPYPDRAVWGGVQQPTTAAILLPVLRMAVLAIFVACGLAMAGAKLSSDLQQQIANADVEVIVQFNRIPTDADLKPFGRDYFPTTLHLPGE